MDTRRRAGVFVLGFVVGIMALGGSVLAAQSEKSIKPENMTCEEFLVLGKDVQPHVVYWIDGYSQGSAKTEVVIHSFERPITVVVNECKKTPKESLLEKIKKFF